MVVPDGVVQAQRLVTLAPLVSRPFVTVDDDAGHPQLTQPRAERDPALPAADDEGVRLCLIAEGGLFVRPLLRPRAGVRIAAVHGAQHSRRAFALLVALQFLQRCQQRPRLIARRVAFEPQVADAAADGGVELDERRQHTGVLGGVLAGAEVRRVGGGQAFAEHACDLVAALDRLYVPGERDQVAPKAVGGELRDRAVDVTYGEGRFEIREPGLHPLLRGEGGGVVQRLSHVTHHTPDRPQPQGLQPVAVHAPIRPNQRMGEFLRVNPAISSISIARPRAATAATTRRSST
jgi:hypothetical protein